MYDAVPYGWTGLSSCAVVPGDAVSKVVPEVTVVADAGLRAGIVAVLAQGGKLTACFGAVVARTPPYLPGSALLRVVFNGLVLIVSLRFGQDGEGQQASGKHEELHDSVSRVESADWYESRPLAAEPDGPRPKHVKRAKRSRR